MDTSEQESRSCSTATSSNDWVSVLRTRALKGQQWLHQSERAISHLACQSASLQLCLDRDDGHRSAPAMLHGLSARCVSCSCRAFPSTPQQQERSRLDSNTPGNKNNNNNSVALMAAKLGLDTNATTSTSCVWTSALHTPCRDSHRPSNDTLSCEETVTDKALVTRSSSNDILLVPIREHETSNRPVLNGETVGSPVSGVAASGRCLSIGNQGIDITSYDVVDSRSSCHKILRIVDSRNRRVNVSDSGGENSAKQSAGQSSVLSHSNDLEVQNSVPSSSVAEHRSVSSCSILFGKASPHSKSSSSSPHNGPAHKFNPNILHASVINNQRILTKAQLFDLVPQADACSGSFNGNSTKTDGSCVSSVCPASTSKFLATSPSQCQLSTSPKFRSKPKSRTLRNKVLARNLFTSEGPEHKIPSSAHPENASPPQLSSLPQLMVPTSCPVSSLITNAIVYSEKTDVAPRTNISSSDQQRDLSNSTTVNTSESKHIKGSEDPIPFLVQDNISQNSSDASNTAIDDKEINLKNETHCAQHSSANGIKLNHDKCLQQDLHCNASANKVQPFTPPSTNKLSSPSKSPTFQTKTPDGRTTSLRFNTSTPLVHASKAVSTLHRGLLKLTCAPAPSNLPTSSANSTPLTSRPCTPFESAEPIDYFQTSVPPSNVPSSSAAVKPASSTSINCRRSDPDVRASSDESSGLSKSHPAEPAETFVPPVVLTYSEYCMESRTNPIDIICSPVKTSMKPKLEHLNLPVNTLEPYSEMYQTTNNDSNPLADFELKKHGENLSSPQDTIFQNTSGTLSSDYPTLVQTQLSHEEENNRAATFDNLNHSRPEPSNSLKSECRKMLENEDREAVTDDSSCYGESCINMNKTPIQTTPRVTKLLLHDSSYFGESCINMNKTPIQTTPRVTKLSLRGLKKLELLKKKQTPLRNFLYPTSCDEPNRKAVNLNYTDNIVDSTKFSGFIEADITTRLPPASSKWKDVQNHSAETNINRDDRTNTANINIMPSMARAANTKNAQFDVVRCKELSSNVSQSHVKDASENERKGGVISAASERDHPIAPLEFADSIQAWQQSSTSQDLENFLMGMSTQKMMCFDENASTNLTERIAFIQQPQTSGDGKDEGQRIMLPLTATEAENATSTNVYKRKSTQNPISENAPSKYLRSSPLKKSRNETSAVAEIEIGDINGMDKSKERLESPFTSAVSAHKSGSAPFSGFSTAGGKHIAVNDEALKKAKTIWSKCDEDNSNNAQPNSTQTKNILNTSSIGDVNTVKWTTKPRVGVEDILMENDSSNTTSIGSFRSAREAAVRVTDKTLENSKLQSEEAGMDTSSTTHSASRAAGFSTARGNVIRVNAESLGHATKFWTECGENGENPPETSSFSDSLTEKVFTRKFVDNVLTCTRFAGFKTAKGTCITISEKSLDKARQVLTEMEKTEDSNPSFSASNGFATAEDTKKETKHILTECSAPKESSSKPTVNLGFTTAKGSIIAVGEEALKKAKFLWTDSESAESNDFDCVSLSTAARKSPIAEGDEIQSPQPLLGFKTAKGSVIEVRRDALEKAKRLWNDSGQTEEVADLGFQIPEVFAHNSRNETSDNNPTKRRRIMNVDPKALGNQKGSSDIQTSMGFSGFKTANGSVLVVDPESVKKAKALWISSNESDSVVPSNQLDQIRPVDVPHPSVRVVKPPIGKTPKRGFIKHKIDTSKISGESGRLPEPATYKGSLSADISGRVYPKNVGRNQATETARSSWIVPTRTTQTVSNGKPMLDRLTVAEQEMLNAQLSSIAEEFLNDEDWNIEGQPMKTTGCVQDVIASNATDLGSLGGITSITALAGKNMPLNETSLSVNIGRNATPAQEFSATTSTMGKRAQHVQLGEENVDPQSCLRRTKDSVSSLKVTTVFETARSCCDETTETNRTGTVSGRSPNTEIGHVPSDCGTAADICDVQDCAAVMCSLQNTGAHSCTATTSNISSTVTTMSASYSSIVNPLKSAHASNLHAAAVTTSHDHCKSGTMSKITVPTPNNFTMFESAHRTPTKVPPTALEAAVSPVLLRSLQIKSKIQQLREQYGTPKPLPPLQASPVVLKIPFKAPLRPQVED